ncbi:CoA pyrophosphatase [uncultured Polaribacter sp.]|uniref:NUDIX hydrolase n=1 Tax=uncultured Polaribacter sp. TaxID=174711 RepID=UPI0026022B5F|nr:CoA pyrophosphatase [uncultured Polaribacter sp.]
MNFNNFKQRIQQFQKITLGGLDAQFKMAPKLRLKYDPEQISANNPKRAAVLALFYPNDKNETTFLLTQRASYKGTHSAQISFPGGKIEQIDTSLQETALRETFEEVGIHPDSISVFRELTDVYIPPSNFLATPFLGFSVKRPNFTTNHEVEKLIEVLLSDLLNDSSLTTVIMNTSYMKNAEVPCFKFNNYVVWGATAMMLSEIKELIS